MHLVVLVHGLFGTYHQLDYVEQSLKSKYNDALIYNESDEKIIASKNDNGLIILNAKSNAGYFTYDGLIVGGERVAHEVICALDKFKRFDIKISKISFVGYSLGGTLCRYIIGILYKKGIFESIIPVNFTTFASPHLGVPSPEKSLKAIIFNTIGPYVFSQTSKQLFLKDTFIPKSVSSDGKNQPLLSAMADKKTIFYQGLAKFQNRTLYANIINDLRCAYFTAAIQTHDPFYWGVSHIKLNYLPGYSNVVLDPLNIVSNSIQQQVEYIHKPNSFLWSYIISPIWTISKSVIILPIYMIGFLIEAIFRNLQSANRIRQFYSSHNNYLNSIEDAFSEAEDNVLGFIDDLVLPGGEPRSDDDDQDHNNNNKIDLSKGKNLHLGEIQLQSAQSLNQLTWNKFGVHIHKTKHAHAAIIFRHQDIQTLDEGEIVISHWLDHVFVP